jgi:hypothetical protein
MALGLRERCLWIDGRSVARRARRLAISCAVLSAWLPAAGAHAGVIYFNDAAAFVTAPSGSVAGFKYRVSNSNFDMSLDRGGGTSAGNFISAGLGSTSQLSGREYDILITHQPGEGFTFSMTSGATTTRLHWGTNAPAGATSAATIGGSAPGAAFNTLTIESRASLSGSTMAFSAITFASPTLTLGSGAMVDGIVTPSTRGPYDTTNGNYTQRISADTDLSQHAWTLGARVTATRLAGGGGDESLRFVVGAGMGAYVPSPMGAGVLGLAALFTLVLRARRA